MGDRDRLERLIGITGMLRLPEDLIPMAYGYLDSVYATGPLDIAAHARLEHSPARQT